MQFIPFLLFAAAALFSVHYFLYASMVSLFSITAVACRYILAASIGFLSVSFLVSSILAHLRENIFTRSFYFLSGFWMGLLANLVLAIIAVRLILWVSPRIGIGHPSPIPLAGAVFTLAVLVSLYGTWNAFHPKVTEISVHIPNLPDSWKGKKIVQLSDVHLGHIYQEKFLQNVVDRVNSIHPEMVVITGDLFDGMDGHLKPLVTPLGDIHADKGIYFVIGNHETYLGVENTLSVLQGTNVRVLQDEVTDVDGLRLIGISFPDRGVTKDMAGLMKTLSPSFQGKPNVLLFHAPMHIDIFKSVGVNLQLSGHTHVGQIFPFGFITKLIFHGHDYGLYQDGGYSLYTTNGVGTWGPSMRIGNTPEIVSITLD
jgi:predicted MPP superfamily phosphohydrolase